MRLRIRSVTSRTVSGNAQALCEGAFVADAKQTPPVPRRRAKRQRGPCGSRLASRNIKAGSAAAPRSRRSPKCSQKAARQCGLVVRPNDVLARERCGLAGSAGGGVLARVGCGLADSGDGVLASRACGLAGSAGGGVLARVGCGLADSAGGGVLASGTCGLAGSTGGGVLARVGCGLAGSLRDGVLASEGIRSMDGAGLQITRCDDGHADPRDVCAPAMTRRAGRAVCAGTNSACFGVITIADPVDKQSSSLFYKRLRGFDFSTSSGPPLAVSLVYKSLDYRHGKAFLFVVRDAISSSPKRLPMLSFLSWILVCNP
jgi:hypothetical protein